MAPAETSDLFLTLKEASRAFDVSLSTLHRRRRDGSLQNVGAFQDKGTWRIPRQGLARLGYTELVPPITPGQTTVDDALAELERVPGSDSVKPGETHQDTLAPSADTGLIADLREQLADAVRRAEVAEAVAQERDRLIAVQQRELERLEPGARVQNDAPIQNDDKQQQPTHNNGGTTDNSAAPPRGMWRKLFGR